MSTFNDYLTIANNLGRYQAMTAADPTVAQATKYFRANIGKIKTIDQFIGNARLFNFAMTAFGLGDKLYAKSLMRQVLQQGVANGAALAHKLNDPKILAFAQAFNFALYGASTTQTIAATSDVASKYVMQTLEAKEGARNEGVQLALYFQQNAGKIVDGYSVLADANLLKVVQTTLGISSYASMENIDRQAAQFDKLLKYADFKDTAKVRTFLERFTAQYDVANPTAATSIVSALQQGAATGGSVTFGADFMMSMQKLKLGG